ncbi:hypothetical protein [Carnobacterium inhibens]|uniref:hypothetical protein n=1 Tax=Carnobacterium inhibens TaxID=147709 RepID=UPI00203DB2A2|nr:hypothetical protein [Carnobacterium inhibens]MCM3513329.1 hypothetical protein [Carnobacterium inhibens]
MDYAEFRRKMCDFFRMSHIEDVNGNYFSLNQRQTELKIYENELEASFKELENKFFERGAMFDENNYEVIYWIKILEHIDN